MGLEQISADGVSLRRRRIHIFGDPNVGKTRSLLTFPGPRVIVSSPGEKGQDTLYGAKDTRSYSWAPEPGQNSHQVLNGLLKQCLDVMTQSPKCATFAFEGLHKIIGYIMDSVTDGAWFSGEEFEPKIYNMGYRMFDDFLSKLSSTGVPVVVFTCWAEREPERPKRQGEKAGEVPTFIRPALPGRLAKQIEGEFGVSMYQFLKANPQGITESTWQTRPGGEVRGCAIKGPKEVVDKIPGFIKADYAILDGHWRSAESGTNAEKGAVAQ